MSYLIGTGLSPFTQSITVAPSGGDYDTIEDVVGTASGTVNGSTVVEEPPIPHSIVAPG